MRGRLLLCAAVAATAAGPGAAAAQERDPGSARALGRAGGFTATTWTSRDGRLRCVGIDELGTSCTPPHLKEGGLFIVHAVRAETTLRPRLGPLLIAGIAGDSAVRIRVRWAGGARTMRARRFGGYLFALPARTRRRDVVITMRHRDGSSNTIDYRRTRPRWRPVPGSERVDQRLADPEDGGPLGVLTWRAARGQTCLFVGDLVGGRVGSLHGRTFYEYPINDGGTCSRTAALPAPVGYGMTSGGGRTVIAGFVRADLRTVDLQLADGTLRPLTITPRRAVAAVFAPAASPYPASALIATLADGTTVTQPLPRPQGSQPAGTTPAGT